MAEARIPIAAGVAGGEVGERSGVMDGATFDAVTRRLAEGSSRRRAVRLVGGAVAALVVGGRSAAGADAQGARCRSFVLSGGPSPDEPIEVDDSLFVFVNRDRVFGKRANRAGAVAPVAFKAKRGDKLKIVARDEEAPCQQLDPLFLHCATGGEPRQLSEGIAQTCEAAETGVFFKQTFTI